MICLPKELTQKFLRALKSGQIDLEKLPELSSKDRHALLEGIVGKENAQSVNALFEQKKFSAQMREQSLLKRNAEKGIEGMSEAQKDNLLKIQKEGIINWAKSVGGLKQTQMKDLAARLDTIKEALSPKAEEDLLNDFVGKKVGADVTDEEIRKIGDLKDKVLETQKTDPHSMEYGRAVIDLTDYVNNLKNESGKGTVMETVKEKGAAGIISEIGGTSKAIKASLDDSFIGRQGWKTIFTNPVIWGKNAGNSMLHIVQSIGGKNVMREINADIISRPTYPLMRRAKLAIGNIEEAFPTHLPEKIPVLGTLYKASETAYVGMAYQMRADLFDKYIDIAKRTGVDIEDKEQLESIGKVVNALTGRGHLGSVGEPAANLINNVFFSPRFLKSQLDFITAHQFQKGVTPLMRRVAAENLLKATLGTAGILYLAHSINPKSVETDPTSSDFGKIKIGDTRFDVTGGMASLLTLAMREVLQQTKSTTTGKVTKLDTGKFGSPNSLSVLGQFVRGKLAPLPSVLVDLKTGTDQVGNKATLPHEAAQLAAPLPITNAVELYGDPKAANPLLSMIADALGISVNTYGNAKPKK